MFLLVHIYVSPRTRSRGTFRCSSEHIARYDDYDLPWTTPIRGRLLPGSEHPRLPATPGSRSRTRAAGSAPAPGTASAAAPPGTQGERARPGSWPAPRWLRTC
ncbi:hypothetical protein BS78_07G119300 [Paspalum vaginatum]|nr:hypothetical protein BS78_07G119300 [Paspalum vaginatum]